MKKSLVVYFSRKGNNYVSGNIINLPVGNTEVAAKLIAELAGADMFRIDPVKEYSQDYHKCTVEAQKELRDNARPELKNYINSIDGYDLIYLCFPNYWGTMPMCVWTFLEKYDFAGKTVKPLCTHEGSGMGRSESDIRKLCPGAKVEKGLPIRGSEVSGAKSIIEEWIK
jgi:flavodoxin